MQLKNKEGRVREECYNCHMLFGSPFYSCCYKWMNPPIRDDGKCGGYTPIIKEKNDGEQHSDEVDDGQ